MKLSQVAKNIAQGTKDLAVASAGVSHYGVVVDGAVKSPVSNAVEVVDEVAEASRGVNSYGTNEITAWVTNSRSINGTNANCGCDKRDHLCAKERTESREIDSDRLHVAIWCNRQ